jgi:restriction system protein
VANRKSVASRLYRTYKKNKQDREKAQRQATAEFEREQKRLARELEVEERRQQRDEERVGREQMRQAEQRERERQKREAQAKREAEQARRDQASRAAKVEGDLKRREAARERERALLTTGESRAEAEARTVAVRRRTDDLERLLVERTRGLGIRCRQAEEAFTSGGRLAFVDVIHQALSTSIYPEGLRGGSKASFHPESRELLIEYELPRRDVIPPVVGYRYVKTADELRPEPRKDAETKKLYQHLIARVARGTSPSCSRSPRRPW